MIRKQILVCLSSGQIRTHALDFDDDQAYMDWVEAIGGHLMSLSKGTVNLDNPYAIYRIQDIVGIEFSEPPEGKPPIGFQTIS